MREEFEKHVESFLLKKFDIKKDILAIDTTIKNNGLTHLNNIKKILIETKLLYVKQILFLLALKAKFFKLYT
ncbi:hypothetical protein DESAMIL20_560 [Desulfurella amilsii]|uniref:Uncharacterized protein n=1 Tax=Desulfurella amilsii TaxID=1562698 RepID=A0A1X4XYR1_9BACT|nr:hypothetical protein [Desulfurella amilsii]OSS42677.1 hypothetical protein DESAMIL20_560 [Desulfurella amilsii]